MSIIVKPNTFTVGATIIASEHNANFDTMYNDYNGNISNNNISPTAGIVDTKLAQITTTNKVDIDSVTSLSGIIVMWSGTIAALSSSPMVGVWALCDGTNGTPDLTDRFVIHADADSGGTNDVGDTGGSSTHTLSTAEMPSHTHSVTAYQVSGTGTNWGNNANATNVQTLTTNAEGGGGAHTNRDRYYALAYIMKL